MQESTTTLEAAREAGRIAAIMESATESTTQSPYQAQELSEAWKAGIAEGIQQIATDELLRSETKRVLRERR